MKKYAIEFTPAARRDLKKLNPSSRQQVVDTITELAEVPRPHGYTKIQGSDDLYRVRSGDYRIIYQIDDKRVIVTVVRIGHRREVYRTLH